MKRQTFFNVLTKTSMFIYLFFSYERIIDTKIFWSRLRERHQDVLRQKLFKLKQEQGVESEPLFPIIKEELRSDDDEYVSVKTYLMYILTDPVYLNHKGLSGASCSV